MDAAIGAAETNREARPAGPRDPLPYVRPMGFGELFDTAFDLYKENFLLFVSVVAVLYIPGQLAVSGLMLSVDFDQLAGEGPKAGDVGAAFAAMGILLLAALVYHIFYVVHAGALSIATADRILGRRASIGSAYRTLLPSLLKLLFTWAIIDAILTAAAMAIAFIVVMFFGFVAMIMSGGGAPPDALGIVIGVLMFGLPTVGCAVALACFAEVTTQVVVLEGTGYVGAIQRNWEIVKGRFWPTAGATIVLVLVVLALHVALALSLQGGLQLGVYSWLHVSRLGHRIVEDLCSTLVSLVLYPYIMIFLTLLYFERRARREGLDIVLRERSADAAEAAGAAGAAAPTPAAEARA